MALIFQLKPISTFQDCSAMQDQREVNRAHQENCFTIALLAPTHMLIQTQHHIRVCNHSSVPLELSLQGTQNSC